MGAYLAVSSLGAAKIVIPKAHLYSRTIYRGDGSKRQFATRKRMITNVVVVVLHGGGMR